jgi:ferritin-like metal-binding protein YciE
MKQNPRTRTEEYGASDRDNMDNDLHELFLDELKDIYDAEQQLTKALPKMAKAAESDELRMAFESHLSETENQVQRLEQVFESLGETAKAKKCKGMNGLIKEGEEMMKELKDTSALDASLIASAQKVEHYEIASYGSLCAWAKQMGHDEAAQLLQETLDEEKAADHKLTEVAETSANEEAQRSTTTE